MPALGSHQPPRRRGRRNSGPQKAEGRLDYYDQAHPQCGQDDDGVDRCGKDVPEDDSPIGRPRHPSQGDKVLLFGLKSLASYLARKRGPDPKYQDYDQEEEALAKGRHERQGQQDQRERRADVCRAHDEFVDKASQVARDQSQSHAQKGPGG